MWSFVGNKENKQWIWFALERDSRKVVGLFVGDRDQSGAQGLWDSLPEAYKESALAYTDFWKAYEKIFPKEQLRQCSKQSGATNHIERFNNTDRQRVSRLVRKTLSFSKKLEKSYKRLSGGSFITTIKPYILKITSFRALPIIP